MEASFLAAALSQAHTHLLPSSWPRNRRSSQTVFHTILGTLQKISGFYYFSSFIRPVITRLRSLPPLFLSSATHSALPVTRRPQPRPFPFLTLFHKPKALPLLLNLIWAPFSTLSPPRPPTTPLPSLRLCLTLSRAVPHPQPQAPSHSTSGLPFSNHAPRPREGGAQAQSTPLPGRSGVGGMGEGGGGAGVGGYLRGGALTMWREGEKVHSGRPRGCACAPPRPAAGMPGAGRREVSGSLLGGGGGGRRGKGAAGARARALAAALPPSLPPRPPLRTHIHTRTPPPLPPSPRAARPAGPARPRALGRESRDVGAAAT